MSLYVPLDANFQDDAALLSAGPDAELCYLRALALAKRLLTDGFIAHAHIGRLAGDLGGETWEVAARLVEVNLWLEVEGGWQIRTWLKRNPSKAEIEAGKEAEREKKRRYRAKGSDVPGDATECPEGTAGRATDSNSESESEDKVTTKRVRAPNPHFDALVAVFGDASTKSRASHFGKIAAELKAAGAQPSEIERRGRVMLAKDWKDAGPGALAKHWDDLASNGRKKGPRCPDHPGSTSCRFYEGTGWTHG